MTLTAEEFGKRYADRSGVSEEFLKQNGQKVEACDCGEEGCTGWAMVSVNNLGYKLLKEES